MALLFPNSRRFSSGHPGLRAKHPHPSREANRLGPGSKFTEWPDFGTFHSGHIDLQDHTDEVWYRNIKIKEL